MNVLTILAYLLGRRAAVLRIAACPAAVWVGAAFVLSAALAREYDGHDLLHEPGHLALPFVASLVTSFLLFCLVRTVGKLRGIGEVPFWRTYRSFLGLYWMTAPLAWLYAIPVERFLSPVDAVKANLTLLGIVSLWRVLLITRAISVLFSCRFLAALPVVLLFADAVVIVATVQFQLSLTGIMGGIRLSEPDALMSNVAGAVVNAGLYTFLVWLVASVVVAFGRGRPWRLATTDGMSNARVHFSVWIAAMLSVLVWLPLLPGPQREQRLASGVEAMLFTGQIDDAVAEMSEHVPEDFPPHWDPPPRGGFGVPDPIYVAQVAVAQDAPSWVRKTYIDKVARLDEYGLFGPFRNEDRADQFVTLLLAIPEGPMVADQLRPGLEQAVQNASGDRREKIHRLLKMADEHRAAQQSSPTSAP